MARLPGLWFLHAPGSVQSGYENMYDDRIRYAATVIADRAFDQLITDTAFRSGEPYL